VAWSRPSNAVAGTQIPAATTNAILGDLDLLGNASATYGTAATVWTAGTNPTIGNGTFVSTFRRDNKWVDFFIQITMGTTTTFGVGTWALALPVTARFSSAVNFTARATDTSASANYDIMGDASTTGIALRCAATTAGGANRVVSSANPFTWASTDILSVVGRYEVA